MLPLTNDLPYLEPLLFWLRDDEVLKTYFTEKSFFMPHNDLITATEEAMKNDCPAPRALWILPQDTLSVTQRELCPSPGNHTFHILLIVQCIRDVFQLVKRNDKVELSGQFMELSGLRSQVKKTVLNFSRDYKSKTPQRFGDMFWVKDQMLYPSEENKFLTTAIEFQVKIF